MSSSESEGEDNLEEEELVEEKVEEADVPEQSKKTFAELGLSDVLVEAAEKVGWKKPSRIQEESIPIALQGKDVIGLAETGSGKTGAFALPILHTLLENPQRLYALVLTPTRFVMVVLDMIFQILLASNLTPHSLQGAGLPDLGAVRGPGRNYRGEVLRGGWRDGHG